MNMKMQNLQPNLRPIESGPKIKFPEKTVSELEGENFNYYVIKILREMGEQTLADFVEQGKIPLGLQAKQAIEMGNLSEKSLNDDFDVNSHMEIRAKMAAKELMANKKKYLN